MPNLVSEPSPQPDHTKRDTAIKALMTLIAAGAIVGCASTNGSFAPKQMAASTGLATGEHLARAARRIADADPVRSGSVRSRARERRRRAASRRARRLPATRRKAA